ncbi:T9SS type A sorting domain-containing protein [candidate division KSB1 bacterium]|nr:T9SS type A sorting domain-containing protein [candidate division KSB1 bacterium]
MKRFSVLCLMVLFCTSVFADFPIYQGNTKDYGCDITYNSADKEYFIVWLESYSSQMKRLLAKRVSENGQAGTLSTISEYAEGLPSIAYNSQQNEYLVVFVSGIAPDLAIYGQRLSSAGAKIGGTTQLIPNANNPKILYNSKAGNFLLIGEIKPPDNLRPGYNYTQLFSRKIGADGQPLNPIQTIYNSYPTSFVYSDAIDYSIAYAPVVSTETPQGRYLIAYGGPGSTMMLDSDGKAMITLTNPQSGTTYPSIPFQQSKIGISEGWDVAFGYWDEKPAFLIVWVDRDNNMSWQGNQWTGIWCGLLDAVKIDYLTTDVVSTVTFPISKIWSHWAYSSYAVTWNPVVEYSSVAKKFMVAWRETPGTDPQNDTQVNHIRGNAMGSDGWNGVTIPANIIISATSGTEDPYQPALAVSSMSPKALVVWEDRRNFNSNDFDIYANLLETTASNNTQAGSDINVDLGEGVDITFDDIKSPGNTTLSKKTTGTPPPGGFQIVPIGSPVYYDIETTATFTGNIKICIQYIDAGLTPAQEAALKLLVYENPPGSWKDITTSLNTSTNTICGTVTHLSEFATMFTSGSSDIDINPTSLAATANAGGSAAKLLSITNSGDTDLIFEISGTKWQKMPGAARDIGVGDDGEAWFIGMNKNENGYDIFRWTGTDWELKPGGAMTVDVGSQNHIVVVNETHGIYQWNISDWRPLSGKARDVSIASDGTMWAIGTNKVFGGYEILKWNGTSWDLMPGGAVKIGVGSQNHIWCVNEFSLIYHWNGSDWDLILGVGSDLSVGSDGSVWVVSTIATTGGNEIFRWNGVEWKKLPGGAVAISVGSADHIWNVNAAGEVFRWNNNVSGLPPWMTINPLTGVVSAGGTGEIMVTFNARTLTPGTYNSDLFITSNDPDESVIQAPVTFEVLPASSVENSPINIPIEFVLRQNYPNPFNPNTEIKYQIAEKGQVELSVYNLLGAHIRTLMNETKEIGYYSVYWDGRDESGVTVPGGIYLYRLKTKRNNQIKKMILLK